MHVEVVLAALVLVVAVLVAADFFRRTSDGPYEYVEGQAHEAGRETFPVSRAGSASSVSSFVRPNWLVRTRLGLLAVVSAAAAALATGGVIHAAGAFQRASAHSNVSPAHDGAVVSAILALVFAVAVLAAGLCSATILIRSVVRPLHQLRAGAVEGRPLAVKAVGVSALDEIGDVARAFDQVQGEVLRLAGQEAGLRGKLSEMFAELSGRGQSLMEHQLRLIDELGQGEQDAGRRASLVTMNRLAARMRRHSQNLLVLAGQELPRHGIKVRLQPAAAGGLTALVWLPDPIIVLPDPIIVLPEADALAGFAPAEPEAQARHARSAGGPRATWRLRAPAPGQDPANARRLPIYEAVESDWFSSRRKAPGGATAAADGWEAPAGSGWDAARIVLAPASSGVTTAGLPVRAPRANLVPGAIGSPRPDDSGPVRSADAARNRLAGFQRGASRGRAASSHDGRDPAP